MPILILDDFGLQALNEEQQEDLYQVIAQRYERAAQSSQVIEILMNGQVFS